jgi:uncharacterized membrane protein
MNAFDVKSALLAKHAQHVVLIHFPIALFMVGATFDVLSERTKNASLAVVAYYNIVVAAIAAVPTAITGILAWRFALEGATLKGTLLLHLIGGIMIVALMLYIAWVHRRARRWMVAPPKWRLACEALTFALLGITAHLGGFLSGVNT